MSAQAVSRITALLALNAEMLRNYLPQPEEGIEEEIDEVIDSEEYRVDLVEQYQNQLTEHEGELLVAGDMNAIFEYLRSKLDRPTGGDEAGSG